jgi:hypothetical protein
MTSKREPMPQIDPTTNERARDVSFYMDDDPKIAPEARSLLQDYSHVPSEQVESHVRAIRDKAWNVFPYPCSESPPPRYALNKLKAAPSSWPLPLHEPQHVPSPKLPQGP